MSNSIDITKPENYMLRDGRKVLSIYERNAPDTELSLLVVFEDHDGVIDTLGCRGSGRYYADEYGEESTRDLVLKSQSQERQETKKRKVVQIAVTSSVKPECELDVIYALCDDGKIFYTRNFLAGGDRWKELDHIPQD